MRQETESQASSAHSISGRIEYFDVLRCVAIVAVVMIHAGITEWHAITVDSPRWDALTWVNSALRFSVPIFFMISGALFLDPAKPISWRALFTRRIPRLLIAYAVWSLAYASLAVYGPAGGGDLEEFVTAAVTGHFHLWFLLALIGLNLGTPILRRIVEDRRVAWYFIALAVPFTGVLPLLTGLPVAGELLSDVLGAMRFDLVLGYAGYFVLGHLLHTAAVRRGALIGWGAAALLGIAVTFLGTTMESGGAGETDERFFDFTALNVAVVAVAVFIAAKAWGDAHRLSAGWARIIGIVAGASFGIYLVHPFFLLVLRQFGVTTETAPPLAGVALVTALAFVLSLGASLLLRAIPRLRGVLA
ncbi:acyltransferase family protein [Leucobacter sp. USCH14]|uniref:acyltransferase n=1 Tax=Leucobacter sp. USCH14 TaxID=3024838 RepID=UPI0030A4E33F